MRLIIAPVFVFLLAVSAWGQTYTISTVAGGGLPPTPMPAKAAWVQPSSVATDLAGNVYFSSGQAVFKLGPAGTLTRVAGAPGGSSLGDGGPATSAALWIPAGVAVDSGGNLYIADSHNNRVRKVAPSGTISTVAGNGNGGYSGDGGPATSAQLNWPECIAVDSAGNLYIAEYGNNRIRKVAPGGTISTVAGNGTVGYSGDGGPATSAELRSPHGVTVDSSGNLYIADSDNSRIRKVSPGGTISTVAGTGSAGYSGDGGPATSAELREPLGVAVDSSGNLYIADLHNDRIRKVSPGGTISTVAGTGSAGYSGDGGPANRAALRGPHGVAVDSSGNLYIADHYNRRIRKVVPGGMISTVAGNGTWGYSGDGGKATSAQLYFPLGVAVNSAGNLYIADSSNNRIRKVTPRGTISTVAGNGTWGYSGDGGPATSAQLAQPKGVAVDSAGNLYIADEYRIRKVSPGGTISTVAGTRIVRYSGDGGPATSAGLGPEGVAVDSAGNLYIADSINHRVRKVVPGGTISTVAGNGGAGYSGDGGPATSAQLAQPAGVAVDSSGNLYIADYGNSRIRKVARDGAISTVAGNGTLGYSGDGGPATSAQLSPAGVAVDASGRIYVAVADFLNNCIRVLTPMPDPGATIR
jgi:sugar lactone lactonase YvrE